MGVAMIFMGMGAQQQFNGNEIDFVLHGLEKKIPRKIDEAGFSEMNGAVEPDIPAAVFPGITAVIAPAPAPGVQFRSGSAQKRNFHAFLLAPLYIIMAWELNGGKIMADALIDPEHNGHYTYTDYINWEGSERYQIINGEAFMMASPTVEHQAILMELSTQFHTWLKGKPCRVFAAPLDVRLFPEEDDSDDTVVQPDLLVVCDNSKMGKGSINGPPDIIVEIVSPSTSKKELLLKFGVYLEAGIREYWVIDPEQKIIQIHIYENGHFISTNHKLNAIISSAVLQGLSVDLKTLWDAAESAVNAT